MAALLLPGNQEKYQLPQLKDVVIFFVFDIQISIFVHVSGITRTEINELFKGHGVFLFLFFEFCFCLPFY